MRTRQPSAPPRASSRATANRAGLEPRTEPLDRKTAAHLLRRTSFFGSAGGVNALVGKNPSQIVDQLIYVNKIAAQPADPPWMEDPPLPRSAPDELRQQYNMSNNDWIVASRASWIQEMLNVSFREKMTLFWHDHFSTEIAVYRYAFYGSHYLKLLRANALGKVRPLVQGIGLESAMLIYLNGNANEVSAPNENYARELLELFTMSPADADGQPNYTENDVKGLARALTGYVVSESTGMAQFVPARHDYDLVAAFGQTGSMTYDDVVDLIFDQRSAETAWFIASKLYRLFVYETTDPVIVASLADVLLDSDFSISTAVGTLLKSQHFYDDIVIGSLVKSPVEFVLQLVKLTGRTPTDDEIVRLERLVQNLDQTLLNPPGVAGWEGHHDWVSTNSMPTRWEYADYLISGGSGISKADLVPLAAELHPPDHPLTAFYLPLAMAEHFLSIHLDMVEIPEISDEFQGDLSAFPVPQEILSAPDYVRNLAKIFLGTTPWYEWYLYNTNANARLMDFAKHLVRYPEFQLM